LNIHNVSPFLFDNINAAHACDCITGRVILTRYIDNTAPDSPILYREQSQADLSDANLSRANLSRANLSGANLSEVKNLISAIKFVDAHFERTDDGYIAYKTFGGQRKPPESWKIEKGAVIEESVNFTRTQDCGSGINVAPLVRR